MKLQEEILISAVLHEDGAVLISVANLEQMKVLIEELSPVVRDFKQDTRIQGPCPQVPPESCKTIVCEYKVQQYQWLKQNWDAAQSMVCEMLNHGVVQHQTDWDDALAVFLLDQLTTMARDLSLVYFQVPCELGDYASLSNDKWDHHQKNKEGFQNKICKALEQLYRAKNKSLDTNLLQLEALYDSGQLYMTDISSSSGGSGAGFGEQRTVGRSDVSKKDFQIKYGIYRLAIVRAAMEEEVRRLEEVEKLEVEKPFTVLVLEEEGDPAAERAVCKYEASCMQIAVLQGKGIFPQEENKTGDFSAGVAWNDTKDRAEYLFVSDEGGDSAASSSAATPNPSTGTKRVSQGPTEKSNKRNR